MANVDSHAAGDFCWFELGTTDQAGAKKFYGSVLGWTADDSPMGPNEVYTMFNLNGRNVGGCYALNADMLARHVPPHWMLYVAVKDAEKTVEAVSPAGGTVVSAPFDVMDFGRMAVLQDPMGAFFAIWEAKTHHGVGIKDVPGTVCWADLVTPEPNRCAEFYRDVFGWKVEPGKDGTGYLHIKNGSNFIGGIPPAVPSKPNAPPHWMVYFAVADSDASTAQAEQAGASVYMPPMTVEGVGRWSIIADPQGAVSALFQRVH
ncbi:MAG: VOC family protein [Bryobacteraceae bacterium]